jgi:hypothetical protein
MHLLSKLSGIRKADCTAHTVSGALSADDSQNLPFIAIYMVQFHVANTTKQMPDQFLSTHV